MNIESTALDSSGLALQPTIDTQFDLEEASLASSDEGSDLHSDRIVCFGCLTAHPKRLVNTMERPRAHFPKRNFTWELDDCKSIEICSESPPHIGPLDDPAMFKPRCGPLITVF